MQKFDLKSRGALFLILILVVAIVVFIVGHIKEPQAKKELNLLCWVGYEERAMLEPFEKKFNVKVNYKTFVGGDQMFALFTQSKGTYDVVVADPEYIEKLHAIGRLAELSPADYNFEDYFEPFKKFPLCWINGKLYAVLLRFGSNGFVYNTKYLTPNDVRSYKILWDPKLKGKIGIWDWYLPSMGVLSRAMGNAEPYNISNEQFTELKNRLMELRPQVAAIHSGPPEMLSALANEQTWIVPAGGEWVAAILQQQGKPIDWTVPDEGGVMWIETLVIPNDAPHPDVAKKYIQWMQTPEAQALLTQREAYNSNVPNKKAYDLLTEQQKNTLKVHNEEEVLALIKKLSVRRLPINQSEKDWQDVWQEFKAR
jgi:spermidine/putrescine transport system substrate-binding protein